MTTCARRVHPQACGRVVDARGPRSAEPHGGAGGRIESGEDDVPRRAPVRDRRRDDERAVGSHREVGHVGVAPLAEAPEHRTGHRVVGDDPFARVRRASHRAAHEDPVARGRDRQPARARGSAGEPGDPALRARGAVERQRHPRRCSVPIIHAGDIQRAAVRRDGDRAEPTGMRRDGAARDRHGPQTRAGGGVVGADEQLVRGEPGSNPPGTTWCPRGPGRRTSRSPRSAGGTREPTPGPWSRLPPDRGRAPRTRAPTRPPMIPMSGSDDVPCRHHLLRSLSLEASIRSDAPARIRHVSRTARDPRHPSRSCLAVAA